MRYLVSFVVPQDGSSYNSGFSTGENGGLGKVVEAASAAAAAAVLRDTWNVSNAFPFTTQIRVIEADDVKFFPLTFTIDVGSAASYDEPALP